MQQLERGVMTAERCLGSGVEFMERLLSRLGTDAGEHLTQCQQKLVLSFGVQPLRIPVLRVQSHGYHCAVQLEVAQSPRLHWRITARQPISKFNGRDPLSQRLAMQRGLYTACSVV